MGQLDLPVLLLSLLYAACVLGVWIAVLVYGVVKWKQVRRVFRAALWVGLAILLMRTPSLFLGAYYADPSAMISGDLHGWMESYWHIVFWFVLAASWLLVAVGALHVALQIAVGQRAAEPEQAYPALLGDRRQRLRGWALGAAIGVSAGIASTLLFWALEAQGGESVRLAQRLMPGLESAPDLLIAGSILPAFVGIAVAEEIFFRGVLQGWITRLLGRGQSAVIVAILTASLVWALGHAGNAEPLWLKLAQIFVLGLVFGWLAYRYSVESAISAHVCLNVSVLAGSYLLELGL